jgi:SAM-dependent methyltransferase
MDLRKIEVRLDRRDVRATVGDAGGERAVTLEDEAWKRVLAAAKPLFDELGKRVGPVVGVTVDALKRRVWAAGGEGGLVLDGDEYDQLLARTSEIARAVLAELRKGGARSGSPSEPAFWDDAFDTGRDGWELGRAAPPLQRWLATNPPRGKRVLVVGCGRGNEARLCASLGAQVTAIDFSSRAVAEARAIAAREGLAVDVRQRDLFELPQDPERYDLIVEHACYCAIEPARRDDYIRVTAGVLRDGGELLGLFFTHPREGGPPFGTSRGDLEQRFGARYQLVHAESPRDSAVQRQGEELLALFRMR